MSSSPGVAEAGSPSDSSPETPPVKTSRPGETTAAHHRLWWSRIVNPRFSVRKYPERVTGSSLGQRPRKKHIPYLLHPVGVAGRIPWNASLSAFSGSGGGTVAPLQGALAGWSVFLGRCPRLFPSSPSGSQALHTFDGFPPEFLMSHLALRCGGAPSPKRSWRVGNSTPPCHGAA